MEVGTRSAEHLLSRCHGGRSNMANMVLAHVTCNQEADNLPLVEKIKLRDQMRAGTADCLVDDLLERI